MRPRSLAGGLMGCLGRPPPERLPARPYGRRNLPPEQWELGGRLHLCTGRSAVLYFRALTIGRVVGSRPSGMHRPWPNHTFPA